jgi:3'-phosphoadenosine 5'-phosphosulfate sulfotransferase (PAPS reductase)/FAD synthetase
MIRYVVGVSGGKDSTALALRLAEVEPATDWEYFITPTGDELEPMIEHWAKLEGMLGRPFIRVTVKERTLNDLIQIHGMLPNFRARWCTRQLKIEPTIAWCVRNSPVLMHVGLRADEDEREGIYGDLVKSRFPFREWGWTIGHVREYLRERDVEIPSRTDCARCYHQRIAEWRDLWRDYPAIYREAAQQEAEMGHTFRSPGRDTWPVALVDLAKDFERGRKIRGDGRLGGRQGELCRVCSL